MNDFMNDPKQYRCVTLKGSEETLNILNQNYKREQLIYYVKKMEV